MKHISLCKVKQDDINKKAKFEEMFLRTENSLLRTNPDADNIDTTKFLYEIGLLQNPTNEELKKFEAQCIEDLIKLINYYYTSNKVFFIILNEEIHGFITVKKNKTVLTITEIGIEGFVPEDKDIDVIINLLLKEFSRVKIIQIFCICNSKTVQMLKRIGFEHNDVCLMKKIGED